jgi:hypothetical protein
MIGVFGEPVHAPNGERGVLPISGEIAEVASEPLACLPRREVSTARGLGLDRVLGELEVDLSEGDGEWSRDCGEESLPLAGVEGLGRRRSSGIALDTGQTWKDRFALDELNLVRLLRVINQMVR